MVYGQLKSETARLNAVKEQILIGYLGLGLERAHNPWSKSRVTFSSKQLLKHLIETVIPMANELSIPVEPPIKFPSPPESQLLGTESELVMMMKWENSEQVHMQNEINLNKRGRLIVCQQNSLQSCPLLMTL